MCPNSVSFSDLALVSTSCLCSSLTIFARNRSWLLGMATTSESSTLAPNIFSENPEKKVTTLLGGETPRPRMTTDWRRFACSWTSRTSSRICLRCCSWSYGAAGGGGGWEQVMLPCLGVICPRVASSLEVSSLIATQMPFTDQKSCLISSLFDSDLDSGAADVLSWGFEATRQLEHTKRTPLPP